ncbi:MAG: hypothetical protein OEM46_00675 [Ignavibacteria bacterium]|nr:hypothetical protein [Ignavibacteria bacterium]
MNKDLAVNTEKLEVEISPVLDKANQIQVASPQQYEFAGDFLKEIKSAQQKIKNFFGDIKAKAYATWKAISSQEQNTLQPFVHAEATIKNKMVIFRREEERKRIEEQRRLQAIEDASAEKERQRKLKEAEKLKTSELKEQRMQEAEEIVAPVMTVQSNVPEIKGQSLRDHWVGIIKDPLEFIKTIANEKPDLIYMIEIKQGKLNQFAQNTKGEIPLKGIEFKNEPILASGGK